MSTSSAMAAELAPRVDPKAVLVRTRFGSKQIQEVDTMVLNGASGNLAIMWRPWQFPLDLRPSVEQASD